MLSVMAMTGFMPQRQHGFSVVSTRFRRDVFERTSRSKTYGLLCLTSRVACTIEGSTSLRQDRSTDE